MHILPWCSCLFECFFGSFKQINDDDDDDDDDDETRQ